MLQYACLPNVPRLLHTVLTCLRSGVLVTGTAVLLLWCVPRLQSKCPPCEYTLTIATECCAWLRDEQHVLSVYLLSGMLSCVPSEVVWFLGARDGSCSGNPCFDCGWTTGRTMRSLLLIRLHETVLSASRMSLRCTSMSCHYESQRSV